MVRLIPVASLRASRFLLVAALTGLLVSCGGGSGDDDGSGDLIPIGEQDLDGDLIINDEDDDDDDDGMLDLVDLFTDRDGDGLDDDSFLTEAEATATVNVGVCGGENGTDADSSTANWNDNCVVERSLTGGEFADSLYSVGIQRVVYCAGFASAADYTQDYIAFADGEYGLKSETAIRAFQTAEAGLTVDGIVGPQTWARLQERISVIQVGVVSTTPDALGFTEGRCANIPMFYQQTSTGADGISIDGGAWELARNNPNATQRIPFSTGSPFNRL